MQICFIGNELYPADRGGIARLLHNMAHQAVVELPTAHVHILLPNRHAAQIEKMACAFPDRVHLWTCPNAADVVQRLGASPGAKLVGIGRHPELFADAAAYLFGAMDIERHIDTPLTHIEIPDHLGYGNLILSARAAGLAFQTAQIACRIHSSFSELLQYEPDYYVKDSWRGARLGMEAECLALADRILAPLQPIANIVAQDPALPREKPVEINFPAVLDTAPMPQPLAADTQPDFVFASRFQPFKRPELFIRAAVRFLDRNPGYSGMIRLMAYAFDPTYLAGLRMMIPLRHARQIIVEVDLPSDARQARLDHAVVVQPSSYESLCLLSYETATALRPILLARDCAAFGKAARWRNGENCLLFDPDPASLAQEMQTALTWRPTAVVDAAADAMWMGPHTEPAQAEPKPGTLIIGPLSDLSAISAIRALGHRLPAQWSLHIYSIGVDFQDAFDDPSIHHHIADACDSQSAHLRTLLTKISTPLVCLATPDALPRPALLNAASQMPEGIVLSALSGTPPTLNIFAGRAPSLALQDSRLAPSCLCLARDEAVRLIALTNSTRRIVAGMVMALQADRLNLIIAPQIWVDQPLSPFDAPDDLRLLGTQLDRQAAALLSRACLAGHDAPGVGTSPLLQETPVAFSLRDGPDSVTQKSDHIVISAAPGDTQFTLAMAAPLGGHMLRCTVVPGDALPHSALTLTLTSHDSATELRETQTHNLPLSKHQLLLLGPFYGQAEMTCQITNPTSTCVEFSLRRIRQLSPA